MTHKVTDLIQVPMSGSVRFTARCSIPKLSLPPSPRVVAATNGVLFLTSGRPHAGLGADPKNLLALASWQS
jgi:hypothetical protein